MPEPTTSFLVAAAGLTTLVNLNNLTGNELRPITGHQFVEKGGEYMDHTLEMLNAPDGRNDQEWARERANFLREHQGLQVTRNELEDKTGTYIGSAANWSAAHSFYNDSHQLHQETKKSSDRRRCSAGIEEAELCADAEFQRIQHLAERRRPDEHRPERKRRSDRDRRHERAMGGHGSSALPVLHVGPVYFQNPANPHTAMSPPGATFPHSHGGPSPFQNSAHPHAPGYPPGAAPPQPPHGGGWYPGPGQHWPPY